MSGRIRRVGAAQGRVERLKVPARLEDRYGRYRNDVVAFATDVLTLELPPYQVDVLRAVQHAEQVAWVGGHAVGKSELAAVLVAWYLLTRPMSRCIVTSATFERQVGRVVFAKLRTLARKAKLPLTVAATRAHVTGFPEWSAEGVPSAHPENFAGFHASRMLVIADEAKALERPVFEELFGVLASATDESRLVLVSTAGPAQGYFYDAFGKPDRWKLYRTPSTESPFAKGFAERMREESFGEQDPVFRMRVLAEFASDVEGQLIPFAALEAARGRALDVSKDTGTVVGVDVARFGDDRSVVAIARGGQLVGLEAWRGLDTMRTAERVASLANAHHATRVCVDVIGVGSGVVDRLGQLGVRVEAVNVGNAARKATFVNLRAELGWALRGLFEQGLVSLPQDAQALVSELAQLRYTYDPHGRIRLEEKDKAKQRLGRSPDLADAAMLALTAAVRWHFGDSAALAQGLVAHNLELASGPAHSFGIRDRLAGGKWDTAVGSGGTGETVDPTHWPGMWDSA